MYVHIQFVFSFCFDVRRGCVCRFTISNSGTTESSNDYSECAFPKCDRLKNHESCGTKKDQLLNAKQAVRMHASCTQTPVHQRLAWQWGAVPWERFFGLAENCTVQKND